MGRASLSDNWVADKRFTVDVTLAGSRDSRLFPTNTLPSPDADLLLDEALATPAPAVCPPLTKIESGGCDKPSCIDYYASPAFLKAPHPGRANLAVNSGRIGAKQEGLEAYGLDD